MSTLGYIIVFTFFASAISLVLVGFLLLHKTLLKRISFGLVSFAAGALLATGFLDTMKEAVAQGGDNVFLWVTLAIAGFFLIERLFLHLHHHDTDGGHNEDLKLPVGVLIFGDALHNFIDGASIAASFFVSVPIGIITSLAVFVHEIPHELGDFGILLHKGWPRGRVFVFNALTGLAALVGALMAYFFGTQFAGAIPVLLAITTGNFIYLSATDLLPEIHHHSKKHPALSNVIFFLLGIGIIVVLTTFLRES
ncbi:MAG: ZIP family metal transporter [Patescibacteria group bacterium]